ncbi:MAG: pyridine nucleotide-disulfide oxidoreductase, partial [Lachnospiraceae bacterium]|nr:pyridine nucleotide-disulfide oxidoreductase [Lachnospiraceae bacterium]
VLHVHDLVDYVSEEAGRAGVNAAKFVKGELTGGDGKEVVIVATEGARYTVPRHINVGRMDDLLTVRFRVGAVFKDSYISVYYNDERMMHRKKQVMAPGEMEEIILQKAKLAAYPGLQSITVKIEKE